MTHIFISYSRKDADFAQQLKQHLVTWGYDVWLDIDSIPLGVHWTDAIDDGLQSSDVIVGVITPDSVESRNVKNEWEWAQQYNKTLVLLYVKEAIIPHHFVSINRLDCLQELPHCIERLRVGLQTLSTGKPAALEETPTTSPPLVDQREVAATRSEAQPIITDDGTIQLAPSTHRYQHPHARFDDNNLRQLLPKIHEAWIEGVLERNVIGIEKMAWSAKSSPDAINLPTATRHLDNRFYPTYKLTPEHGITHTFDQMQRELLILGDPGTGKTMALLEVARDLLVRAQRDPYELVPIVLNLSTWADKGLPINKWIQARLGIEYQVPHEVSKRWLKTGVLVLLFDGLDEVIMDARTECVEALNVFWRRYRNDGIGNGIVVCSRNKDYEILDERLNLGNAIRLSLLDADQVEE